MKINMNINGRLDLYWNDQTFKTQIQDITEDHISIGIPMNNGSYLALAKGDIIDLVYYDKLSLYGFKSEVIGRSKDGGLHEIFIHHPKAFRKIQRRDFVRVDVTEYVTYVILKEETDDEKKKGIMLDISGGGMKLKSDEKFSNGDKIRIFLSNNKIKLVLDSKIVRSRKDDDGKFVYGISFEEIDGLSREKVIKYVFDIMRKQRKLSFKEE